MWFKLSVCLLVPFALNKVSTENVTKSAVVGFGYELLLAKMDYMEYKFLELQVEMKEQGESLLHSQEKSMHAMLEQTRDSKQSLLDQTRDILEQQKIFANHETFKNSIFELRPRKHPSDNSKLLALLSGKQLEFFPAETSHVNSCLGEQSKRSGRYWLEMKNVDKFEVYCEQTFYGGGWIVVQNRFNGSVDFYRNWTEYKTGFGSLDGEFWLGLKTMHLLTSARPHELLVHLEDYTGNVKYAKYGKFAIGSEIEQYSLKTLEAHSGTLRDSLDHHKGHKFTTRDVDNDGQSSNCAHAYFGGWWYVACHASNLNGLYKNAVTTDSMCWHSFLGDYHGLKVSKMMIREL